MTGRILIVEDELMIASDMKEVLEAEGRSVVGIARSYREAQLLLEAGPVDLVIMDIHLRGDVDGITAARLLQASHSFALVYLTAYGSPQMVESASDTRPRGYLVKPVNERTLAATVATALDCRAHERGAALAPPPAPVEIAPGVELDPGEAVIRTGGREIRLTQHERRLLELLAGARGRIVPYRELERLLSPDVPGGRGALKTLVWRLRRKLPGEGLIEAVRDLGYRLP